MMQLSLFRTDSMIRVWCANKQLFGSVNELGEFALFDLRYHFEKSANKISSNVFFSDR